LQAPFSTLPSGCWRCPCPSSWWQSSCPVGAGYWHCWLHACWLFPEAPCFTNRLNTRQTARRCSSTTIEIPYRWKELSTISLKQEANRSNSNLPHTRFTYPITPHPLKGEYWSDCLFTALTDTGMCCDLAVSWRIHRSSMTSIIAATWPTAIFIRS